MWIEISKDFERFSVPRLCRRWRCGTVAERLVFLQKIACFSCGRYIRQTGQGSVDNIFELFCWAKILCGSLGFDVLVYFLVHLNNVHIFFPQFFQEIIVIDFLQDLIFSLVPVLGAISWSFCYLQYRGSLPGINSLYVLINAHQVPLHLARPQLPS